MATAKRHLQEVIQPPPTFTLELSEDEANALIALVGTVHVDSPAREINSVYEALNTAGASSRHFRITTGDNGYAQTFKVHRR